MKISRLHVRGFGKIEDFNTDLSKGLNVIYGQNESGKSTLMAFIKAILYGLKGGRANKDGLAAESKRYMPWGNVAFGGHINFELDNGSSYRIDRTFDTGVVKLYDESFNDITSIFAEGKDGNGMAQKLIGLGESIFERTVYIKQMGTKIDNSASKDLLDRISNIRQSGTEDISYKNADTALKEALKQQVGTDRSYTRPLDIINKRLEELDTTKKSILHQNKELIAVKIRQEELALQLNRLTVKERLFARLIEFCEIKNRIKLNNAKNEEIRFLKDGIKRSQRNISIMSKDKALLELEIANNSKQLAMLREQQDICKNFEILEKASKQRAGRKVINICSILSLVIAVGVGCGAFVFNTIAPMFIVIPVLTTIVFVALSFKSSIAIKRLEDELKELDDKGNKIKNQIINADSIDKMLQQQLVSLTDRITNEKTQYAQLVGRLENQNINFEQMDITTLENEIDRVSETISELRLAADLDLTPTENDMVVNILENNSDQKCLRITELKEFLTAEIQQKKLESATLGASLKKSGKLQNEEIVEDEIARLTQQKRLLEQRGEALSIAIKTLEEASNDVQKKYIPVMNKVFKGTFSELTTQKYSDIRAGENLSIMLSDPNTHSVVPVSLLSSGTIDQLYLALRIAISETVLKTNESLPFIMDEPFAQYDDERTDNALSCIYDISKKQQIIIFTCKQREVDLISSQYPCKICSLT